MLVYTSIHSTEQSVCLTLYTIVALDFFVSFLNKDRVSKLPSDGSLPECLPWSEAGLGSSWEPRTQSGFPTLVAGSQLQEALPHCLSGLTWAASLEQEPVETRTPIWGPVVWTSVLAKPLRHAAGVMCVSVMPSVAEFLFCVLAVQHLWYACFLTYFQ